MELKKGLEDVPVAETSITYIDGELGRLFYRGYPIAELAENSNFEETSFLLWYGYLPKRKELEEFKRVMAEERKIPQKIVDLLRSFSKDVTPIDVIRTGVSMLGAELSRSDGDNIIKSIGIVSKMATMAAYYYRIKNDMEIIEPREDLSHAQNFLYMVKGEKPSDEETKAMDVALVIHMDHEMNASTFACMVVVSTLSDIYSGVVAGMSALKGPLHGGANSEALKMFLEIGSPEKATEYVIDRVSKRQRIMGFGHRVYKAYDPRAKILKKYAKIVSENKGLGNLYEIAERVEDVGVKMLGQRGIFPNVDFYSGLLFYSFGFSPDFYPVIFSVGRVVGWTAHAIEYLQDNRIIRPVAIYTGDLGRHYVDIDRR